MDLYLYTIYYRKNDVVKNVSNFTKLEGSLKYPTNELNPIIRITLKNQTELPRYTYAYIPEFRRYYFIENIQAFSSELFDLYMHVDVLMTYIGNDNAILRTSNFYVERNDYDYNEFYVDDRLPRKINNNVTYKEIANASLVSPDLLNLNTSSRNYLLVLLTDLDTRTLLGESSVTSPSYFPNPVDAKEIKGRATNYKMGYVSYILTYEQALIVSYYILIDATFKSLVVSFTVFPFDLRLGSNYALINDQGKITISKVSVPSNTIDLTLSDPNIDKNIYAVQTPALSFNLFNNTIGVIKSNINNGVEFYNYGQYSKYELYVPYVGFIDINWDLIQNADDNDRFRVQLATNVQTGESSILILIGGIPYKLRLVLK